MIEHRASLHNLLEKHAKTSVAVMMGGYRNVTNLRKVIFCLFDIIVIPFILKSISLRFNLTTDFSILDILE